MNAPRNDAIGTGSSSSCSLGNMGASDRTLDRNALRGQPSRCRWRPALGFGRLRSLLRTVGPSGTFPMRMSRSLDR